MSAALLVALMGAPGPAFPCSCLPAAVGWLVSALDTQSLGRGRQAGEPCVGRSCSIPPGRDCHNHRFLDLWVLTALSMPPTVAAACAGVTHFKPRLTSKGRGFLPVLLLLNSLSKCNWRMSQ